MTGHEYLKRMRLERGLSLREFGEISGVNFATIKAIEDGRSQPLFGNVIRILNALGIPMSEFLKASGYVPPKKLRSKVSRVGFEPTTR